MFDFYTLLELAQIRAINAALDPSAESLYRIKCRTYSETFNTPLHEVMDLDPLTVLTELYEHNITPQSAEEDLEELLDKLHRIQDPNYMKMTTEETEDLVDAVLTKELARLGKTKNKKKEIQKPPIVKNTSEKEVKSTVPKSGGISFGGLDKAESEVELNKGGFKD